MRKTLALVILALVICAGCDDSQYRKANRSIAGISSGLKVLEQADETAYAAGEIDKEYAAAIAHVVVDATFVTDEAVNTLKQVKSLDPQSRAQLLGYLSQLTADVEQLQSQGALHIKNPESQAKFASAVSAVQISITGLASLLEGK